MPDYQSSAADWIPLRHYCFEGVDEKLSSFLLCLQAAGIRSEGEPHFWITADGSCKLEGMNNVIAKLWEKKQAKMLCMALSLPLPSNRANPAGEDSIRDSENVAKRIERSMMNKLLLVGCDQSGTSTIFKQAKILYNVPFSEDEKQNIKDMIQRNLYRYISILLEGREHFREEDAMDLRRRRADKPGPSVVREESDHVDEKNALFVQSKSGKFLELATANHDDRQLRDKAFQAIFKRRNELPMLPRVANYFLDRDGYMESLDHNEPPLSCELIRVHANSLGENCKWLEMFEDSDLFLFCISLTEYADSTCWMKLSMKLPCRGCEWFQDFNPVMSKHPHNPYSNNNPSLAQRASHYVGVKFKRLFYSLTGRKLFVVQATGLEADSVDKALRYGKEILKWEDERHTVSMNQDSSESFDPSSSAYTS
ncbi:hypothetical protein SASPL_157151 [Salvia splendens]|uniref:Uncharacterized protein n=1 Tax=Salvia splendens TaxID=180675 RepID=A0A8X8YVY2_SALSN|nr:hypothetical protein SASPL_157151 [Salvia splendens]